jgi:glycosyltransferase involved in cell wall biosynthesis
MFLSIVIPTYNRAGYIGKTLSSLLSQDAAASDFEIIVIDDGSTDNTRAVMETFDRQRVRYFRKENGERSAARNYGARLAKGDYINFFDSDDLAYPHHVRTAWETVQRLQSPEVFHLGYDVKDDRKRLVRAVDTLPAKINDLLIDGNHLSCNGVFIRTDVCLQYPFLEKLHASEDYQLWLRLAARFDFHCINTVTSTVVDHQSRSVLTMNEAKFVYRIALLQTSLEQDERFMQAYGSRLGTFRAYLFIYTALHFAMAGLSTGKVFRYLLAAVRNKPTVLFSRRFAAVLKNTIL